MIDINHLREHPELYKVAATKKRISVDIDAFLALDTEVRSAKKNFEELRAQQNSVNKTIAQLKGEEKDKKLAEMKEIAARVKELSEILRTKELQWEKDILFIPSVPLAEVPEGKDDSDNLELRKVGNIPQFAFTPRDHIELGKMLDILDIERGVKLAGARSYFLKGEGARLQHALMSLAMDVLTKKGYTLFDPPHLVQYRVMSGTSYFPGGEEAAYALDTRDEGYHLIGTAEVPVTAYHMDETLELADLPKRYAGYSPCYRRESGTYGKDTQGLYRVHQFYKVEQVILCKNDAEESKRFHQEILKNAEEFLQLLNFPYRVVANCGGDLGRGQLYKNDIETWMPSRKGYGETHSCSTFHEYQSRRLNLRYRDTDGKLRFVHTLNNTFVASPRIFIPLIELNQREDGSVAIPEALQPYMGGQKELLPKKGK